ncbi:hypothetical protein APSETT445_009310 [Aspergillus pseudonomiae]
MHHCKPAKTVRRRGVAKKSAATSQASRLEEKIDSLVSLMKAGGQTGAAVSQVISSAEAASKLGTNQEKYSAPASDDGSRWNGPDGDQTNASTPATTDSVCSPGISDLSSHESEECLNHFRTFKLQYFPFVHIPFDKSAGELRRERPFLWLCIMAISTKSTARQHELGLKIRQIVAQEMVSLHDASEGTGLADDEAALFSNVKAEIFKSSLNDGYVSFSFAIFSQVSRCLLALYRLATLDAPNWDKNLVQQTANPLSILNRLVNALEQVPAVVGIDNSNYPNGDLFSRSAQILRSLRPEWESKLGSDDMVPVEPSTHDLNGIQMPDASFFGDDSLYDSWFMELMSCPI